MVFFWPGMLWFLAALPLLTALYLYLLGRNKKTALRYANLAMVKAAMSGKAGFRRHIPPVLFLTALGAMVFAMARPAATVVLPSQQGTVILAMDISGSMRADDVVPNRITAAQEAAKAFIKEQPRQVRIGVVAFAATATVVQPPTVNKEEVAAAIDRFRLQRGTAIGSGILTALAVLLEDDDLEALDLVQVDRRRGTPLGQGRGSERGSPGAPAPSSAGPAAPAAPGSYKSAVVILLTDGQATTGPDPLETARLAADRGIRIFTVGLGTEEGQNLGFEGWSMRVRMDPVTLKGIANITGGNYYQADNAANLTEVYRELSRRLVLEKSNFEIGALFTALAAVLVLVAAALSVLWFNRVF